LNKEEGCHIEKLIQNGRQPNVAAGAQITKLWGEMGERSKEGTLPTQGGIELLARALERPTSIEEGKGLEKLGGGVKFITSRKTLLSGAGGG